MKVEKLNIYKTCCYLTRLYNKLTLLTIIFIIIGISMCFIINWFIPSIMICISLGLIYHLYTLNNFIKNYLPVGHDIEVRSLSEKNSTITLFCGDEAHYQYAVKMYKKL